MYFIVCQRFDSPVVVRESQIYDFRYILMGKNGPIGDISYLLQESLAKALVGKENPYPFRWKRNEDYE